MTAIPGFPNPIAADGTDQIRDWCDHAGLSFVGLRLLSGQALVTVRDDSGAVSDLTFPDLYKLYRLTASRPSEIQNREFTIFLHSASLAQIAAELDYRAAHTIACLACSGYGPRAGCPECHGTGYGPWPELSRLAAALRDLLPF